MLNKTLKVSAAVMFGAMLGSSTVIAQEEDVRTGFLRIFAKETLLASDKATFNEVEYYRVRNKISTFQASFNLNYAKRSNEDVIIEYELDGAVFFGRKEVRTDNPAIDGTATFDIRDGSGGVLNLTRKVLAGGAEGDNALVFIIGGTGAWGSDDAIVRAGLHPLGLPVDSEASLRVVLINKELSDILEPKILVLKNVFGIRQALTEEAEPRDLLTSENLRSFADEQMAASVGSITLSVAHPDPEGEETHEKREGMTSIDEESTDFDVHFYDSARGEADISRVDNVTDLIGIGDSEENGSYFTFDGDFSFASKVTVDKSAECDGEDLPDLLSRDADGNVTDTSSVTWFVERDNVTTGNIDLEGPPIHLCIHVDGKKPIPSTGPYMVTTTYAKADTDQGETAFAAEGGIHELGSIQLGGTTVHIPWITAQERYNQRLTIVNRGPETRYKFTFRSGDGTTASPLSQEGRLPKETSLVLKVRDLVKIDGSSNDISADLEVYGKSDDIDVSSTQVNLDTGDSDTVVYQ